eukprot:207282-Chlamydomonas_euryale.AAC.1
MGRGRRVRGRRRRTDAAAGAARTKPPGVGLRPCGRSGGRHTAVQILQRHLKIFLHRHEQGVVLGMSRVWSCRGPGHEQGVVLGRKRLIHSSWGYTDLGERLLHRSWE